MADWTDAIVGERMRVDREFAPRVDESRFSNQEWGLVMTATEFDIENADDPDRARIVADTDKVPQVLPALNEMSKGMGAMSGAGTDEGDSGGLLSGIKDSLLGGGGGGTDDSGKLEAAERLTGEYAEELQRHLEENGKWEQVRIAYLE